MEGSRTDADILEPGGVYNNNNTMYIKPNKVYHLA